MTETQPQMGTEGDVLGPRILALVIDTVILSVVGFVVLILFGVAALSGSRLIGGIGALITFLLLFVVQFGYFIYFEANGGQTPGKQFMDIVVVTTDGNPIGYEASVIRNVLRVIDGIGPVPYLVGLVLYFVTDRHQRLGDIFGDTVVVRAE